MPKGHVIRITINGVTRTRPEWCRIYGVNYKNVMNRCQWFRTDFLTEMYTLAGILPKPGRRKRPRKYRKTDRTAACRICLECDKTSCEFGICERFPK